MRKLFGTDGIRGVANKHPMTIDTCLKLSAVLVKKFFPANISENIYGAEDGIENAIFSAAHSLYVKIEKIFSAENVAIDTCSSNCLVVIGKDTRASGDIFEHALAAAFCSHGINVKLIGVCPTPAVSILTRWLGASLGIMVSASHNPYYDNGIKIFNGDGMKLTDKDEEELESIIEASHTAKEQEDSLNICVGRIQTDASLLSSIYNEKIKNSVSIDNNIAKQTKIVVDSANGSFSKIAPDILRDFGFDVISINDSPNGVNINDKCGAACHQAISFEVREKDAHVGIAFDGDGDRVLLCDEYGDFIDGDCILAILAEAYNLKDCEIVSTIMANYGLERYLKTKNIQLVRTNVGDRYVAEHMKKSNAKFGGEQSGHIIIKDHVPTGDGLFAALKILEYMLRSRKKASELRKIFHPYPTVSTNIRVSDKSVICSDKNVISTIRKFEQQLLGRGKLIVRASGTEPLIRILAEGENSAELEYIVNELEKTISNGIYS